MKINMKVFYILLITTCLSLSATAQPGFDDDVNDAPLDGGIAFLLGASLVYGAKKSLAFSPKQNQGK